MTLNFHQLHHPRIYFRRLARRKSHHRAEAKPTPALAVTEAALKLPEQNGGQEGGKENQDAQSECHEIERGIEIGEGHELLDPFR